MVSIDYDDEVKRLVRLKGNDPETWQKVDPKLRHDVGATLRMTFGRLRTVDVDDLVQEAMLRAWRNFDSFCRDQQDHCYENLQRFVRTIAKHLAIDYLRRSSYRKESPVADDQSLDRHADEDPMADEALAQQELTEALARDVQGVLDGLSQRARLLIIRTVIDEESQKDLASNEERSHAAVRKEKERAMRTVLLSLFGGARTLVAPGIDGQLVDAVIVHETTIAALVKKMGEASSSADESGASTGKWPDLRQEIRRILVGLREEGLATSESRLRAEKALKLRLKAIYLRILDGSYGIVTAPMGRG